MAALFVCRGLMAAGIQAADPVQPGKAAGHRVHRGANTLRQGQSRREATGMTVIQQVVSNAMIIAQPVLLRHSCRVL
jgi:hypothetical protein